MSDQYVLSVFKKLSSNPTGQDIDFLVEAHTRVGYLAAQAEGLAEEAEAYRKFAEAQAYLEAKSSEGKITDAMANAEAATMTHKERVAEAEAIGKAKKLKNLLDSIREAINAVKFIEREAGGTVTYKGKEQ